MTAVESVLSDFYLWVGWEPYTWLALFMVATLADAGLTPCHSPQSPPRAGFFTPARISTQQPANSPISPLKTGRASAETAPH